jgi:hypothetical protein
MYINALIMSGCNMLRIVSMKAVIIISAFLSGTFLFSMERPKSWQPNPKRTRTGMPAAFVMSDTDK